MATDKRCKCKQCGKPCGRHDGVPLCKGKCIDDWIDMCVERYRWGLIVSMSHGRYTEAIDKKYPKIPEQPTSPNERD